MVLAIDNLTVGGEAGELVRAISFHLEPGVPLTLLGETGSGKSLLALAIMGTLPTELHASGSIRIGANQYEARDQVSRRVHWGHQLALLPQEPWAALDPLMRASGQVGEAYRYVRGGGSAVGAMARAIEDLRALGLEDHVRKYPFTLSGGMAQRVAFAAARAGGAGILIADEPTKGLDADRRDDVVEILRTFLRDGGALLTITHDVTVARALGGRVAVMLDGAIVEQGSAATVLASPTHSYTARLLAAEPAAWPTHGEAGQGEPILEARGLTKAFGDHMLFTNVSVDIHRGDRIAITGPSGSGKTTLGNVLLGLLPPSAGHVRRLERASPWRFQKLYQDPLAACAPRATLRQLLDDLLRLHRRTWADAERLLARLRLSPDLLARRPDQISGGELQRFNIVRVLLVDPVLVFADEPTSRLDPITQQETLELLVESTSAQGCALLLVTHDPTIASKLCPRVFRLESAA